MIGRPFAIVSRRFLVEIFGDDINLLLGFSQQRERRWSFVDCDWSRFRNIFRRVTVSGRNPRSELGQNFSPESVRFLISEQCIPFRSVNRGDELPDSISHAIKVIEFIYFVAIYLFSLDILSQKVKQDFNILGI